MVASLLAGFALGLSLILAIGPQNAFLLRQGLRGEHVGAVVAVCAASDAALIALGVAGFAALSEAAPWVLPALRWGGAAVLALYAARAAASAWRGGAALGPGAQGAGLRATVATALALTWLNPHVYLDTVVLVGAVAAGQPAPAAFGLGAASASLLFFAALGFGARLLRPLFVRPSAWRLLDALVAVTMAALAARLVLA
jgi:L-lysine exporter family protein LysE/ArgO